MTHRFSGKTAVVTGASSGIGLAAARMFAAEGANVVLAARGAEALERGVEQIRAEGGTASAVATDVADRSSCERLLAKAAEEYGGIDILVNNAGTNSRGAVESVDVGELAQIVDVNLRAPIVLSRLVLPYLRKRGAGSIVNVASLAGRMPLEDEATYSATKFGLRTFTLAMAEELEGEPIHVSVVSPGPVDTGFIMEKLDEVPDLVFSQPMSTAEQIAALVLDCAADGRVERARPAASAKLATLAYLAPVLRRTLKPLLERKGRRAKARYRARAGGATA